MSSNERRSAFFDRYILVEGVTPIDIASMQGTSCPREVVAA